MAKNFVSNKDESVRMFKSDFLESLSRVHFTVPLILYVPVVLFFLYRSIFVLKLSFLFNLGLFVTGAFGWSFIEYFIHRFVFHYYPSSDFGKKIHFIFHGVHHDYPNDSKRLVMVPTASIPLAFFFYFLFIWLIGDRFTPAFYAGFVTGYLFYDITHYALHHWNFKSRFWLELKNHHMLHHYKDSKNGFGVSSKVWDFVFHTGFKNMKEKNRLFSFLLGLLLLHTPLLLNSSHNLGFVEMGDKYFTQMKYKDAIAWYKKAPENPEAQWKLCRAYICHADIINSDEAKTYYESAVSSARRSVQLDEKNNNAHTWLAAALGNIAMYEGSSTKVKLCNEIKKELDRAISLNSKDDVAYSIMGTFYHALGNISWLERNLAKAFIGTIPPGGFVDSERCLQKAIQINPNVMRHWFELGMLYQDWDKPEKAKQAFASAMKSSVLLASDKNRMKRMEGLIQ